MEGRLSLSIWLVIAKGFSERTKITRINSGAGDQFALNLVPKHHNFVKRKTACHLKCFQVCHYDHTRQYCRESGSTDGTCRAKQRVKMKQRKSNFRRLSRWGSENSPALLKALRSPFIIVCIQIAVVHLWEIKGQFSQWPRLHPHPPTLRTHIPPSPFDLRVVVCLFVFSSCLYRKCAHPN